MPSPAMHLPAVLLSLLVAVTLLPQGDQVLAAPSEASEASFNLSIIHLNDFHARFEQVAPGGSACRKGEEDSCVGGISRVVAKANELLAENNETNTNTLLLNAGDNFQGTLWYTVHGWEVVAEFLNYLPWDAVALGNHEFDRKIIGVVPFLEALNSTVVAANIDASKEPTMEGLFESSVVKVFGFKEVGIIGTITTTTKDISSPEKLEFLPEAEVLAKEGARLKAKNVNIIVVLSHSGIEVDLELAATDPNVDIIVGGHSHTLLYTGDPPSGGQPYGDYPIIVEQASGRKVAVVQAYCYSMYLGNLFASFDEYGELITATGNPIYLDKNVDPDPEVDEALKPWADKLTELAERELGNTTVLLEQANGACAVGECNLGSFVADAMVHSFAGKGENGTWTRAAIGITNSGGLRAPIAAGVVTFNDLVTTLPFENTVDYLEVSGAGLRRALEQAVGSPWSRGPRMRRSARSYYGFLQLSGLHVQYYEEGTNGTDGEKVRSVEVLCHECDVPRYEPLDEEKWYPVAINNFLAGGGDSFYVFEEEGRNHERGELDADVVENYIKRMSPVIQARDGRIVFVKNDEQLIDQCDSKPGGAGRIPAIGKVTLALIIFGLLSMGRRG